MSAQEESRTAVDEVDARRMSFFEHLRELRVRLAKSFFWLIIGVSVAYFFKEKLLAFLSAPLVKAYEMRHLGVPNLNFADPVGPFLSYLYLALVGGFFLASPLILWQVWAFVSPGLYSREKKYAIPFVLGSTICFVGGAFFGYATVLPIGFDFFLGFSGDVGGGMELRPVLMMEEYLSFTTRMLLAFGLVFELPLFITFLSLAGVVNWLQLVRFSRWFIIVAVTVGAILTPPDVTSQILMTVPLILLYFLSIALSAALGPKVPKDQLPWRKKKAKPEAKPPESEETPE
ncbi:MAG: twin-arginine translocase subunit TatC [Deltaproteobacteria bacterium]|nr:twin-arginine translocase subunit TatC [Deltaproteobacteria bacterium]